ncbi:transketolase [Candidatus Sulfidibacterium hydrothermale]|uniref:transketolase n=1 Tax=Candidatus Sulfidibacterium hydrothermale TaxID=2875962 RepID=UPI001F0AC4EB|nr:transketolase [Candidatus Sulfidibacterium hydrothermale]UBM63183.1 transketolase [Candidatus Sulfidibacterium hydrothermale]
MNLNTELDKKTVAVIRSLVMDGTRKANSGHPGGAMSSTDMAYILFKYYLKTDPHDPRWLNRDRFVLSAGHESMLLYALLHLQGYLPLDELKRFRQWGSLTPGHPEYGLTPGVDATTGPLGQGVGMSVGMAIAETVLAAQMGNDIIDHYTYVLAGDGDLQEPIALGAAANAGHFGLGKLILFYDKNNAQISGSTSRADSTDIKKVFDGFGWQVLEIDGHDHVQISLAIDQAREEKNKPTIIIGHTVMAKGAATVEGDFHTHGSPLPPEEIAATKAKNGLPADKDFYVPEEVYTHFRSHYKTLKKEVNAWKSRVKEKSANDAAFAKKFEAITSNNLTPDLQLPEFKPGEKLATRASFGKTLAHFAQQTDTLLGGSADLEPSNNTKAYADVSGEFTRNNRSGRNLSFAVREFPMATILNGIALHGGFRPFGATFLVFSDYAKPAMRLSALMELPVLYTFTHDSFYVGEDGPTHEPIEQLAGLRALPEMYVFRPAEARETAALLQFALGVNNKPSTFAFTRQGVPTLEVENVEEKAKKGAYIVDGDENEKPDIILIASGSEVHLARSVAQLIQGKKVRVVSMPSMELFDEQPQEYKDAILPPDVKYRVSIEAASTFGWAKYVANGWCFGLDHFGASAPAGVLEKEFGFTPENIAKLVEERYPQ